MTDKIVVLASCGSAEEAGRVAERLVDERLAACVNVVPKVQSVYRWKGAVERAGEWLLVIKTSRENFDPLRRAIEAAHAYETPEILALPVVDGAPNYLEWLATELKHEA